MTYSWCHNLWSVALLLTSYIILKLLGWSSLFFRWSSERDLGTQPTSQSLPVQCDDLTFLGNIGLNFIFPSPKIQMTKEVLFWIWSIQYTQKQYGWFCIFEVLLVLRPWNTPMSLIISLSTLSPHLKTCSSGMPRFLRSCCILGKWWWCCLGCSSYLTCLF